MSDEHYLAAKEIAAYLYEKLGYVTKTGNKVSLFVSAVLNDYEAENNIEPTYFYTKNGMMRVFPNWSAGLYSILEDLYTKLVEVGDSTTVLAGGRNYSIRKVKPRKKA